LTNDETQQSRAGNVRLLGSNSERDELKMGDDGEKERTTEMTIGREEEKPLESKRLLQRVEVMRWMVVMGGERKGKSRTGRRGGGERKMEGRMI